MLFDKGVERNDFDVHGVDPLRASRWDFLRYLVKPFAGETVHRTEVAEVKRQYSRFFSDAGRDHSQTFIADIR